MFVKDAGRFPGLRISGFLLLLVAALVVAGCAGDDDSSAASSKSSGGSEKSSASDTNEASNDTATPVEETKPEGNEAVAESAKPADKDATESVDASAVGSFSGRILLDGDAPELAALIEAGDANAKDKEVCGVSGVPDESLIVGEGNGIANVLVYLRRAPKGYKSEPPAEPVVLDQKGCIFLPHVALIRAGQQVLVKSNDAVIHNVHTFPKKNPGSNIPVNANDREGVEISYKIAESDPVAVKCDIHTWMTSYHLVLDHPFMAVTDEAGNFSIAGLPAGDYQFRIWHETGGVLDKGHKVTVSGDDKPVELKYSVDQFKGG